MKRVISLVILLSLAFTTLPVNRVMGEGAALLPCGEEDTYFDDALFIGDSLFQQLHRVVMLTRQQGENTLGSARFLYAASYTLYASSLYKPKTKAQLRLSGKNVSVVDAVKQINPGKLVFLMGMNDGAGGHLEKDLARYEQVIDRVREVKPDIIFIALTLTPVAKSQQTKDFNQKNVDRFNNGLVELCSRKGVALVDVCTPLKNEEGFLNLELSNDYRVHLNDDGLAIMLHTLRLFAREQCGMPAETVEEAGL